MNAQLGDRVAYQMPGNLGRVIGEVIELGPRGALVRWDGGVWADWCPVKKIEVLA